MNSLRDKGESIIKKFCENREEYIYALKGGKRLRPIICLQIGENFIENSQENTESIEKIALAIELIHNSSLIIDDLPCMDDDDFRRGIITFHKKYGEGMAIQYAMILVTKAMSILSDVFVHHSNTYEFVNELINKNLGVNGLPYGQYIDIKQLSLTDVKNYKSLIYKKTTTLFNLAFILPYVIFVSDSDKITHITKASKWFGLLFQIYDDFDDIEQDKKDKNPNIVLYCGLDESYSLFKKCISKCILHLDFAGISKRDAITEIIDILKNRVDQKLAY